MDKEERIFNLLLGLSILSWGVLGLAKDFDTLLESPVRWFTSALNFQVGTLFLIRRGVSQNGNLKAMFMAMPTFIATGFLFKRVDDFTTWPLWANILFVSGCTVAMLSFFWLGRNFAIFPARREIVVRGPYRIVRHPAYLGELLMATACFSQYTDWLSLTVLLALLPLLALRIHAEERLLLDSDLYQQFTHKTKFKLVPWLW